MATNILCRQFKNLKILVTGILKSNYTTSCHQQIPKGKILPFYPSTMHFQLTAPPNLESNSKLTAGHSIIDMSLPEIRKIQEIIDNPININMNIIEPIQIPQSKEDKIPTISLNLPMIENKIEKQAARLIVIRRKKMKKHKLRKLRKKMKYVWGKVKTRRELRREKAFQQELCQQIEEAEVFDAKAYVASRLKILDTVRIPSKWRGELLPQAMIREFMREKKEKIEKKRNKPRLTL